MAESPESIPFDPHDVADIELRIDAINDDDPDAYLVVRADGDPAYLQALRNYEIAVLSHEAYRSRDTVRRLGTTAAVVSYYDKLHNWSEASTDDDIAAETADSVSDRIGLMVDITDPDAVLDLHKEFYQLPASPERDRVLDDLRDVIQSTIKRPNDP